MHAAYPPAAPVPAASLPARSGAPFDAVACSPAQSRPGCREWLSRTCPARRRVPLAQAFLRRRSLRCLFRRQHAPQLGNLLLQLDHLELAADGELLEALEL